MIVGLNLTSGMRRPPEERSRPRQWKGRLLVSSRIIVHRVGLNGGIDKDPPKDGNHLTKGPVAGNLNIVRVSSCRGGTAEYVEYVAS